MSNEEHFYRNEYENLRRKKNKEIEILQEIIDTLITNTTAYLEYKGLVNEYINFIKARELKNE